MGFKDKSRYQSEEYKEYQRNYQRVWHQRNKEKRLALAYGRKAVAYKYIQDFKNQSHCVDCGQSHPATLHFHHLNSDDKLFNIGEAVDKGISLTKIKAEIDKCIVLCANCHAIRHYNERNKDKNSSGVAPWLEKYLPPEPKDAEASDD